MMNCLIGFGHKCSTKKVGKKMTRTKKEETELKMLIGLGFYDTFKSLTYLSKEDILSNLENNTGFWDLIDSIKKSEENGGTNEL